MVSPRALLLGLPFVIAGCMQTSTGDIPPDEWQNRTWRLVSINGKNYSPQGTTVPAGIRFESARYSFFGPCNGGSGEYTYGPGGALNLDVGPVTTMLCFDPKEDTYFDHIDKVRELRLDGAALVLVTSDRTELRYTSTD